jgi:hypothetical protein
MYAYYVILILFIMDIYIRRQQLKLKYSKLLTFNKAERVGHILTNFFRRKYFIEPINLTPDEIKLIPPMFRYRCYIYETDELDLMNQMYDMQLADISENYDGDVMQAMTLSIEHERKNLVNQIKHSAQKIPVMVDLRIWGKCPDIPVEFNGECFTLDQQTQLDIVKSYNKISNDVLCDRFEQFINWTKECSNIYGTTNVCNNYILSRLQNKKIVIGDIVRQKYMQYYLC